MRSGLRLQLLALLGALMVLAFVPLFFATSAYTRLGFEKLEQKSAEALAESVAVHVGEARSRLIQSELLTLLSAQAEGGAVQALFVYDAAGALVARAGRPEFMDAFGERRPSGPRRPILRLGVNGERWQAVFVPDREGGVVALTRIGNGVDESKPLVALMGLYMVVIALLVLMVAYFALTRWIVRPILALESSAERVAHGGRSLKPIDGGPAELVRLSHSLVTMTQTLLLEEDSLRRKIQELEAATEMLRTAQSSLVRSERLATVGRLSAGLAHEIGNPISALMGFEDLLLAGGLTAEEQRDFLERMRKETSRIHRVLGDLLAYARPSPSSVVSDVEPGAPERAVADVLSLLRPQKDFAHITWSSSIAPELPRVPLSHEQLTQVLLNLVMNAVDACERRGSIAVRAERNSDGDVELVVQDDGPGIPAAVRDTLFEPFVSTKEVGKGTGLGLAVTRGLVESARGSIRLDLAHSPGARFVIVLPAAPSTSSSNVTA